MCDFQCPYYPTGTSRLLPTWISVKEPFCFCLCLSLSLSPSLPTPCMHVHVCACVRGVGGSVSESLTEAEVKLVASKLQQATGFYPQLCWLQASVAMPRLLGGFQGFKLGSMFTQPVLRLPAELSPQHFRYCSR